MNLGGIKVSAAEVERVLMSIPQISECATVAAHPAGGGPSRLVIYAVIAESAAADPPALLQETRATLARDLNPLFRVSDVVIVKSLPQTASNKVLRRQLSPGHHLPGTRSGPRPPRRLHLGAQPRLVWLPGFRAIYVSL
jgi:acetyl-CoA synthetase